MESSQSFFASMIYHIRMAVLATILILVAVHASVSQAQCYEDKGSVVEILQNAKIAAPVDAHVVGQWRADFGLKGVTFLTISENRGRYTVNVQNSRFDVNITREVAVCPIESGKWRFAVAADFQDNGMEVVEIRGADPRLMNVEVMALKLKGRYQRVNQTSANLIDPDLPESALDQVEDSIRRL
jgi:hypothetical protein